MRTLRAAKIHIFYNIYKRFPQYLFQVSAFKVANFCFWGAGRAKNIMNYLGLSVCNIILGLLALD